MVKTIKRIPLWFWLVLAAVFIFFQATTVWALEAKESFWNQKPCGFKEVELDQGDVPEKIRSTVAELASQGRKRCRAEPINGRIFSVSINYDQLARGYRVRSIEVRKGGKPVYLCEEKVCQ